MWWEKLFGAAAAGVLKHLRTQFGSLESLFLRSFGDDGSWMSRTSTRPSVPFCSGQQLSTESTQPPSLLTSKHRHGNTTAILI